jgi:hypothetical protein
MESGGTEEGEERGGVSGYVGGGATILIVVINKFQLQHDVTMTRIQYHTYNPLIEIGISRLGAI